jgi:uncharacterized protein
MTIKKRIENLDWQAIEQSLWDRGYAKTTPILTPDECTKLIALYRNEEKFRSRINMARHQFGVGEYRYFADPLPPLVQQLREQMYPLLAPIANRWMEALRISDQYPPSLTEFLSYCQDHGQTRPTPLLLYYEADGYNCMHQDLYGAVAFPLQLTFFLSRREEDYTGGEFLLVEQRPRAQSRGEAIATEQGEMIIFTTRYRPALGKRGYHRVQVRHGVSTITSGSRYTLGVIFHNAK